MRLRNASREHGAAHGFPPGIAKRAFPYHISGMSRDDPTDRGPEYPRSEPEIIPPGRTSERELSGVWVHVDERDGVHRVYLKRPGPFSIILALLAIGAIAVAIFLVVASLALIWIPIAVIIVAAFLLSGTIRYYWYRLRDWLAPR